MWKTLNIHPTSGSSIHWFNTLDASPGVTCTSIGTLAMDASNRNHLIAACAPVSAGNLWGEMRGILRTLDGGISWFMTTFPPNLVITSLLVRNNFSPSMLVAVKSEYAGFTGASLYDTLVNGGIWASLDNGQTWNGVHS